MSLFIEDGKGTGSKMGVNVDNQGLVQAEVHELNHYVSLNDGQVYQTVGEITTVAAATETVLHMACDSSSKLFVISFIRMQVSGVANGTALPAVQTYFELGFGRTYASDGVAQVPVNMNRTSGNVAALTCYDETPTMAGTFTQFDKWYPEGGGMLTYSKQGSIILGLNDTMEIRLVTDHTAGNALVRVTGMFVDMPNA
jgi:hypothetical protein